LHLHPYTKPNPLASPYEFAKIRLRFVASSEKYVFGEFTFDAAGRELRRSGQALALTPKAHDVLAALVKNAPRLVTKRELLDQVWRDSFVEEGVVAVHISAIRKALGDRDRRYIETVSRAGYRFIGRVDAAPEWRFGILPANAEVYELVGRGRAHLMSASFGEIGKSIEAFSDAIALDSTWSAAHAGLAWAYCAQAQFRLVPPQVAYEQARAAALRALAMDQASADAQVTLATVLFLSDWNWTGAERSLARALELSPDHTQARMLYGQWLEVMGRLEEGLRIKMRCLQHEPHSALVHLGIAQSQWNLRNFEESIRWANKALDLDPHHLLAREFLAGAYWKTGDEDAHLREIIRHAESYGVPSSALDPLKDAYARGGREAVVRLGLEHNAEAMPALQRSLLHAEAGELDAGFEYLDRAIASHDPSLVYLAIGPQFDRLRKDSRFPARVHRMGLRAVLQL
jgi:DNA-binding winged helix-turn-helix (wHTH) protein